ncbi:MAG TPA: glycosyltransferase family 2 protein [Thermoanaerobaculia bacterium]
MSPDVSIVVVAHDSEGDLPLSLASALAQRDVAVETLVVDNASSDRSREIVRRQASNVRLIALPENAGFAAAMNAGIEATSGRYLLSLNPDCRLAPDFAATLTRRLDARPDVGSAAGRIYRAEGADLLPTPRLDSTGIVFTPSGRHFDRGSEEEADGRYVDEEEVAGTTAAAGFYRREALASAKISTGYFDSDFFVYREDADLAWRLAKLGWKCLYVPGARAWHRRRNLPERRRRQSSAANFHSVKNRFLLRINNQSSGELLRTLLPTLARDLVVVGACLTVERSSLPAFSWLWRNRKRLRAKRREIQKLVASRPVAPDA